MSLASKEPDAKISKSDARQLALAQFEHVEKQVALATTTAALIVTATTLMLNAYLTIAENFNMFHQSKAFVERFLFF